MEIIFFILGFIIGLAVAVSIRALKQANHAEAMNCTSKEFVDEIEAPDEDEATTRVRKKGFFVTKITKIES